MEVLAGSQNVPHWASENPSKARETTRCSGSMVLAGKTCIKLVARSVRYIVLSKSSLFFFLRLSPSKLMQAQSHVHFMSASHMLVLVILLAQS